MSIKHLLNNLFIIQLLIPLFYSFSQTLSNGQITFNFNGTVDGNFNSITEDSIPTGILINQENSENSQIIVAGISNQYENSFNIFLSVLQDTVFPLQARNWEIPGQGNEDDPLSLEALTIFLPNIDSSFAEQIFNIVTDSTDLSDSINLEAIFEQFSNDLYLGLSGELDFHTVNDTFIGVNFNIFMVKPAFYFPPHTINIQDGQMDLNLVLNPSLWTDKKFEVQRITSINRCYPNPFNSVLDLELNLGKVNNLLTVYDITGKEIQTLLPRRLSKGKHLLKWNAKNLTSGPYFIMIQSGNTKKIKRVTYLK